MEAIFVNSNQDQSLESPNVLSRLYRKPKKYELGNTLTEKQKIFDRSFALEKGLKPYKKKHKVQYFANIRKQQMQSIFQKTFIKKLKSSIVLSSPPQHQILSGENSQIVSDTQSIQIHKSFESLILFLNLIQSAFLLVLISFTFIFQEIAQSIFAIDYLIFSCLIHLAQIFKKFINHTTFEEKKVTKCKQIIKKYVRDEFMIDLIIFFSFIITLTTSITGVTSVISRILIFLKLKEIMFAINYLEITFIKNVYKQQIWSLIKVLLFNFIFAHIISIVLVFMTEFSTQQNWLIRKGIQNASWYQIYIWAYYWATTVMLTVGFGDLIPTTTKQATFMIFIQMMSCMVLAYNFNCIGTILTKIRSYQAQRYSNLKTFNYMKQNSSISQQTTSKIMNYIKQSTQIKRNFNIQEEKRFMQKLPPSFKNDLLKERHRTIWDNMMFFRNLSQKTLLNLSVLIQKKLAHPGQIVYKRQTEIDLIIFNKGGYGYSYNNGRARKNGTIIQQFQVSQDHFKIISLDFLLGKNLNYDVRCTDYSIVYRISKQAFSKILKQNVYDFEYYSMFKDKDKFWINQFELQPCRFCHKQRHSLFKCTKFHYIPLAQHIIQRHKDHYTKKYLQINGFNRMSIHKFKPLRQLKNLKSSIIHFRNIQKSMETSPFHIGPQKAYGSIQNILDISAINMNENSERQNVCSNPTKVYFQQAVNEIKSKLLGHLNSPGNFNWDIELDEATNYKIYFRKDNPDQISFILNQRKKQMRRQKNSYPFRCQEE